jgi:DNA-binding NtrC family response regulator
MESHGARPRLLVVDDEEAILLALHDYFTLHGFEVSCARDRVEAGAHLEGGAFDGVIADLRLAGSGGLEGLEVVERARALWPRTRTVIVTAYGSPDVEREVRRRGVDAFFHKPVRLTEIARVVARLIEDAHASQPV